MSRDWVFAPRRGPALRLCLTAGSTALALGLAYGAVESVVHAASPGAADPPKDLALSALGLATAWLAAWPLAILLARRRAYQELRALDARCLLCGTYKLEHTGEPCAQCGQRSPRATSIEWRVEGPAWPGYFAQFCAGLAAFEFGIALVLGLLRQSGWWRVVALVPVGFLAALGCGLLWAGVEGLLDKLQSAWRWSLASAEGGNGEREASAHVQVRSRVQPDQVAASTRVRAPDAPAELEGTEPLEDPHREALAMALGERVDMGALELRVLRTLGWFGPLVPPDEPGVRAPAAPYREGASPAASLGEPRWRESALLSFDAVRAALLDWRVSEAECAKLLDGWGRGSVRLASLVRALETTPALREAVHRVAMGLPSTERADSPGARRVRAVLYARESAPPEAS